MLLEALQRTMLGQQADFRCQNFFFFFSFAFKRQYSTWAHNLGVQQQNIASLVFDFSFAFFIRLLLLGVYS